MDLPPMPRLEDFSSSTDMSMAEATFQMNLFKEALATWERVCKFLIAAGK